VRMRVPLIVYSVHSLAPPHRDHIRARTQKLHSLIAARRGRVSASSRDL
jgi:hypothetical protein